MDSCRGSRERAWRRLSVSPVAHPLRGQETGSSRDLAKRPRQPAALAVTDGGKTLLVANRRSGSLSVIDTERKAVVAEHYCRPGFVGHRGLAGRSSLDCTRSGWR